jgi:hypothetical protein
MLILPNVNSQFVHGADQCAMLEKFLSENKKDFETELIGDLSHINHRAECYNGITVEDITYQSGSEYCLSYSYDWFVYNGCADMDEQGKEDDVVCFSVGDCGEIEFEMTVLEERSTYNEF